MDWSVESCTACIEQVLLNERWNSSNMSFFVSTITGLLFMKYVLYVDFCSQVCFYQSNCYSIAWDRL